MEANITKTKEYMRAFTKYLGDVKEKQKRLKRMIKHFNKERIVAEKTLEENLEELTVSGPGKGILLKIITL